MNIVILCRVVDNFGDAGFCYRLAMSLLKFPTPYQNATSSPLNFDSPFKIDIITDKSDLFIKLSGGALPKSIRLLDWDTAAVTYPYNALHKSNSIKNTFLKDSGESPIILECFQCGRPQWLDTLLFNTEHKTLHIIMIDYLTAESYAEDFHKLPSLTRKKCVQKVNFMPGFTSLTGGLIFDENTLAASPAPSHNSRDVLFFSYTHNLPPVISALDKYNKNSLGGEMRVLLAAGAGKEPFLEAAKNTTFKTQCLPYLTQKIWDATLYSTPILFIRGEDSLARACLSGRVFVWQAYPQSDSYQLVKVKALLSTMKPYFNESGYKTVEQFFLSYNDDSGETTFNDIEAAATQFLESAESLRASYESFSKYLISNGDFTEHLLEYVKTNIIG